MRQTMGNTVVATTGGRPVRVLVIEDDALVRANLIELLEEEGMRAIGAEDGRAGIELAKAESPSLVLCDVRMPRTNGFDVLRAVRASPSTCALPFIFLSAATDREQVREGMALGADDYVTKPFTRHEVLGAIRARLGRAAQLAEAAMSDPAARKRHEPPAPSSVG